jgi:hypothetical protein
MTDATVVQPGTTGKQSEPTVDSSIANDDVALPPRIQQVADVVAEVMARGIREANSDAERS